MRLTSLVLLFAFAVSTFAFPMPDGEKQSPNKYDDLIKELDLAEQMANDPKSNMSSVDLFSGIGKIDEGRQRKSIKTYAKTLRGIVKVAKVITDPKANPTDEELVTLAKDLSKTVREVPVEELLIDFSDEMQVMTPENLKVIVDLLSKDVKHEGNNFLGKLKDKSKDLYCTALNTKTWVSGDDEELKKQIKADCPDVKTLPFAFVAKEILEYLRSEEMAVKLIKDVAVLVKTLHDPTAFDSLDSLHAALAKSERWEANGILIRNLAKCIAEEMLSDEEKAEAKMLVADLLQELKKDVKEGEAGGSMILAALFIPLNFQMMAFQELREKIKVCLVTGDTLKNTALSDDVVLDQKALDDIKSKDQNAWAVLYLVNEHVKGIRARDGLSKEADAFTKKVSTVPNFLLLLGKFFGVTNKEVVNKGKELKGHLIDDFNALPAPVKEELIHRFPFRTLVAMTMFQ